MKKFRFHMLGLVHLPCSREYMSCAFTQKNIKLAEMLLSLGHEVFYYGAEGSTIECTEFIQTHTLRSICEAWGDGDNRFEIGYDWTNTDFRHDFNQPKKECTIDFLKNSVEEIVKRRKPDDFLLCTQGIYHQPVADMCGLFLTCEPGIGYRGAIRGRFRAFESSYIQNFVYGSEAPYDCINGSYYDRVIPNYFDPKDIEFSDQKGDYYLFIGRMIKRKGIITAAMACNAIGKKLIIAGQGAHVNENGCLIPNSDPDFMLQPGTWEYVGYVGVEERKKLMSKAIATFTPTEYLECFAGTHVESMLHGTPVITTSFGVYPETIPNVVDGGFHLTPVQRAVGFKCHTLQDFVDAAKKAKDADPDFIRAYSERYLMDNVKMEFQKWFEDLYQVYLSTTSGDIKGWSNLK